MTTSALRRQVKNIVHNYSEAEIKVREATSNDPWGPSSSLMSEIADLTFNVVAFAEVMGMVWKRLNDSGKNWRHVYKALTLLDYLLKTGSERVAQQCRENAFTIQTLRDFQYIDRDGRDQGANVREKARQLVCLLKDEERLRQERSQALKTKERMAGGGSGGGGSGGAYGEEFSRSRGSPSSFNSSSSSPRAASDLEQARPQTSGEEELQLQLALAMSREETFLSLGLSSPSPTNPFHCDQPRLTLNQMRPASTSPLPPHMLSYSPSLPLPLHHQLPVLPSSFTQPPAAILEMPTNLPQPLLPLSPRQVPRTQAHSNNPFL
uniref:ENTH domain-containing protein n=1 Tax=Periophthalmus magnuspinnatus TaxID=409849 RepID=A0A3B4AGL5_9GOBI